ncbi:MAG TPA: hypothetical protein VHV55_08075 [Pirellulales bacterium]|nr:hypothetical protein [Pirellulales bacterium]
MLEPIDLFGKLLDAQVALGVRRLFAEQATLGFAQPVGQFLERLGSSRRRQQPTAKHA